MHRAPPCSEPSILVSLPALQNSTQNGKPHVVTRNAADAHQLLPIHSSSDVRQSKRPTVVLVPLDGHVDEPLLSLVDHGRARVAHVPRTVHLPGKELDARHGQLLLLPEAPDRRVEDVDLADRGGGHDLR